jgi:hypothetical protein
MMMMAFIMFVMVTVSAAFRLESGMDFLKVCSEATEHVFNHLVGSNKKDTSSNLGRQVPIAQVPGKAHELDRIFMPDFDNILWSGLDLQPSSIFQSQAVAIRHGDGLGKVQEDIFSMVGCQANSPAMTRVEIKRESAEGFFVRPMSSRAMDGSALHDCPQYRK